MYYDDQGWVVAYLPKNWPAAAIWKYDPKDETTDTEELENNLLVLAINEVLKADGEAAISPGDVNYYDWENENCNAFALFSAVTKAGGKIGHGEIRRAAHYNGDWGIGSGRNHRAY